MNIITGKCPYHHVQHSEYGHDRGTTNWYGCDLRGGRETDCMGFISRCECPEQLDARRLNGRPTSMVVKLARRGR